MTRTHTLAQYVVTYANHDGETIQRGPVSASEALAIADDVTPYLPGWAGPVSFYLEGDYDGEITVMREDLVHESIFKAPSQRLHVHTCEMCEMMIAYNIDFCEDCAYEVGFETYPVSIAPLSAWEVEL